MKPGESALADLTIFPEDRDYCARRAAGRRWTGFFGAGVPAFFSSFPSLIIIMNGVAVYVAGVPSKSKVSPVLGNLAVGIGPDMVSVMSARFCSMSSSLP